MSRHFVLGTWANADEYDYSGEMLMGSRNGKSVCMDHILPSGMANLSRYGDPVEKPRVKKATPIQYKITPAQRTIDRLEGIKDELEQQFEQGIIEFSEYVELSNALEIKLERAWVNLDRQLYGSKRAVKSEQKLPATLAHPETENVSTGLFSLTNSMFESIAEGVSEKQANKPRNKWLEDAKNFLLLSAAGAMLLIVISH